MKITIQDDGGKELSLETALTVIPTGHAVLICPANKDIFISDHGKGLIEQQFAAMDIRAIVVQSPVCVWAIANNEP